MSCCVRFLLFPNFFFLLCSNQKKSIFMDSISMTENESNGLNLTFQNRVYYTWDISFLNSFGNVLINKIVWKLILFWKKKIEICTFLSGWTRLWVCVCVFDRYPRWGEKRNLAVGGAVIKKEEQEGKKKFWQLVELWRRNKETKKKEAKKKKRGVNLTWRRRKMGPTIFFFFFRALPP